MKIFGDYYEYIFLSANRSDREILQHHISILSHNNMMKTLLTTVDGALLVLNENREVVAFNKSFMEGLDFSNEESILGARPGEVLGCEFSNIMPFGCGTSEMCKSCNAAIAIASTFAEKIPKSVKCSIKTKDNQNNSDTLFLRISTCFFEIDSEIFILLFLQDITRQENWASLENVFFHDFSNILTALFGTISLIGKKIEKGIEIDNKIYTQLHKTGVRLLKEFEIQKALSMNKTEFYSLFTYSFAVEELFSELETIFSAENPIVQSKKLNICKENLNCQINSDYNLILRILINMLKNAFEESNENDEVKLWLETKEDYVVFNVWNNSNIPQEIFGRIFQKNFSTKDAYGRGLGTYSMKFFGEKILKGRVDFSSSEESGTIFSFKLPIL